jgi:hypothetical protein
MYASRVQFFPKATKFQLSAKAKKKNGFILRLPSCCPKHHSIVQNSFPNLISYEVLVVSVLFKLWELTMLSLPEKFSLHIPLDQFKCHLLFATFTSTPKEFITISSRIS